MESIEEIKAQLEKAKEESKQASIAYAKAKDQVDVLEDTLLKMKADSYDITGKAYKIRIVYDYSEIIDDYYIKVVSKDPNRYYGFIIEVINITYNNINKDISHYSYSTNVVSNIHNSIIYCNDAGIFEKPLEPVNAEDYKHIYSYLFTANPPKKIDDIKL